MMKLNAFALALLAAASPLYALEISLEENRGERGSIGFVDLQAVFRRFPETRRAKQSYSEIVRQAEEQLNLRKADLIRLRSELAALKAEREAAASAPIFIAPPAPTPAPEAASAPAPAPALTALPGMSRAASTEPLKISIPGIPEEDISTVNAPANPPPLIPAIAAPTGPTAADLQARAEEDLRRRDAKVKELAASIVAKAQDLSNKEAGLGDYQVQVEQNLVSIESKRAEILLGRIYKAVREAAVENSVSVVIDKSAILFGQGSVDLTDKVLKKLEGSLP